MDSISVDQCRISVGKWPDSKNIILGCYGFHHWVGGSGRRIYRWSSKLDYNCENYYGTGNSDAVAIDIKKLEKLQEHIKEILKDIKIESTMKRKLSRLFTKISYKDLSAYSKECV